MLPPICSAAPSRPALPPTMWVTTVAAKITGVSIRGTFSPKWMEWMISLVPLPSIPVAR